VKKYAEKQKSVNVEKKSKACGKGKNFVKKAINIQRCWSNSQKNQCERRENLRKAEIHEKNRKYAANRGNTILCFTPNLTSLRQPNSLLVLLP
jgi:hypothetical protein